MAVATLQEHAQEPVISLMQRCHEKFKRFAGSSDKSRPHSTPLKNTMTWLGVGNVDGVFLHTTPSNQQRTNRCCCVGEWSGIVCPTCYDAALPIASGDLLIFVMMVFAAALSKSNFKAIHYHQHLTVANRPSKSPTSS